MNMLAINGARFMSSAMPCHKDGKVLHPDLINENIKQTTVITALGPRRFQSLISLDPQQQLLTLSPSQSRPAAPQYHPQSRLSYFTLSSVLQYAVRGELFLKAGELQAQGKEIIFTNVGNPHQLGCKPLTFTRQVRPFVLETPLRTCEAWVRAASINESVSQTAMQASNTSLLLDLQQGTANTSTPITRHRPLSPFAHHVHELVLLSHQTSLILLTPASPLTPLSPVLVMSPVPICAHR
jgi:hypothetical protein